MEDERGSAEFKPIKLGPRRRRFDPVAVGLMVTVAALVLAIVKPWGGDPSGIAAVPSSAPPTSSAQPPVISTRGALVSPTWSDILPVVSRRTEWGIRTIVIRTTTSSAPASSAAPSSAAPSAAASQGYAERWVVADFNGRDQGDAVVDGGEGAIVALGVTFPQDETPLAVRIWLDHAGGELEWIDARPIDQVPARGAYLFLRRSVPGGPVRSWGPGRYRVDVLVGGGIRRIDVEIPDGSGNVPDPEPWSRVVPRIIGLDVPGLAGLPSGLFAQVDGAAVPLASTAGPPLDETGAWMDVDRRATDEEPWSYVARTYQPRATQIGVVLPPTSVIRSMALHRLAPFDDIPVIGGTAIGSGEALSFVVFAPPGGAAWRPGVYALSVEWVDGDGPHDRTWHVELRPGPLAVEPVLLSAARAWARYAGSTGVLLGTTESIDGASDASAIRLLEIVPHKGTHYPGLSGSDLIGCGPTIVHGRPTVIGLVGPVGTDLAPVTSRLLYPFADTGPLEVLTVAEAMPGLTLVTPFVTAEFGGPAAYGFRAGSTGDAPGYTICIGLVPPAG